MITQFDKTTCKLLAKEVEEALATLAAKHGLAVAQHGGTIGNGEFIQKIRFNMATSNPAAADVERAEFAKYAPFYGLTPEHYGTKVPTPQYGDVTLIGFLPKRPKFPVKVRCADGTIRIFAEALVAKLKAATPTA